tara:strand:- start:381 stop:650 length:270 start_codon:yes stop_codon:yes gene_type:complete
MKIQVTKTIVLKEHINLNELQVHVTNSKDIDSDNLEVEYKGIRIGEGHLNNKTNFAHVSISEGIMEEVDECDLIDYLVDGIESRSIRLN